jgi:Zn ribbon nucleic-acid-binding protein
MDSLLALGICVGVLFVYQSCCYCSILRDISSVRENQSNHNKCFVCTYEKHMAKYHRQFTSPLQSIHIHSQGEDPSE